MQNFGGTPGIRPEYGGPSFLSPQESQRRARVQSNTVEAIAENHNQYQEDSSFGHVTHYPPAVQVQSLLQIQQQVQYLRSQVYSLQFQLNATQDVIAVQNVINHHNAIYDDVANQGGLRIEWTEAFTVDAVSEFPFGIHHGREGKGDWVLKNRYFENAVLMVGALDIGFMQDRTKAFARAGWVINTKKGGKRQGASAEGGVCLWICKRMEDGYADWRIEQLKMSVEWSSDG
jgi:hypothetical protein